MKSGFVSIIGRPNVGKSTLLNTLINEKVAITSKVAGTTRNIIQGIYNEEGYQIVFVDTPGIHKPKTKLGETMINTAFTMFSEVDVILFLIEATSDDIGRGDRRILDKIIEIAIAQFKKQNKHKYTFTSSVLADYKPNSMNKYAK